MWALSAQLSLAQSDEMINLARCMSLSFFFLLPTCIDAFTTESELNGNRSHFSSSPCFFCSIFLLKTTTTITNEE